MVRADNVKFLPDSVEDMEQAIKLLVAVVAGAAGGGLIISHQIMRHKVVPAIVIVAYMIVGAVLATAMAAYMYTFGNTDMALPEVVLYGIVSGAMGSVALGLTGITMKFFLRRLGLELDVTIKQLEDKE